MPFMVIVRSEHLNDLLQSAPRNIHTAALTPELLPFCSQSSAISKSRAVLTHHSGSALTFDFSVREA